MVLVYELQVGRELARFLPIHGGFGDCDGGFGLLLLVACRECKTDGERSMSSGM